MVWFWALRVGGACHARRLAQAALPRTALPPILSHLRADALRCRPPKELRRQLPHALAARGTRGGTDWRCVVAAAPPQRPAVQGGAHRRPRHHQAGDHARPPPPATAAHLCELRPQVRGFGLVQPPQQRLVRRGAHEREAVAVGEQRLDAGTDLGEQTQGGQAQGEGSADIERQRAVAEWGRLRARSRWQRSGGSPNRHAQTCGAPNPPPPSTTTTAWLRHARCSSPRPRRFRRRWGSAPPPGTPAQTPGGRRGPRG